MAYINDGDSAPMLGHCGSDCSCSSCKTSGGLSEYYYEGEGRDPPRRPDPSLNGYAEAPSGVTTRDIATHAGRSDARLLIPHEELQMSRFSMHPAFAGASFAEAPPRPMRFQVTSPTGKIMYYRTNGLGEPAPQVRLPPYVPPYPNIQSKLPGMYPMALAARAALAKLAWFKEVYVPLMQATGNAHLALNQADEIVVIPDEATTTALIGATAVKSVLKQAGKTLFKDLISKEFGMFLGVLDIFHKTLTALSTYDAKRLVNDQRGSRFEDAYRYKLRFFIGLWMARMAPQADRAKLAYRIEQTFFQYQKAQGEVWKYDTMERNLAAGMPPDAREPPRMYPR